MSRGTWILIGVMGLTFVGLSWASSRGLGIPQPTKEPVSIREGSPRGGTPGRAFRPRYFIGGGVFSGK